MHADVRVEGIVQGVGFRPFVYRTALKHGLVGYVRNLGDAGVEIVLEGERDAINWFVRDLKREKPPLAVIDSVELTFSEREVGFSSFRIIPSSDETKKVGSVIPPDVSICEKCVRELRDPKNRRYRYFFITCTDCGPRYTIIKRTPYDRENTTMREFPMCEECRREYSAPDNRRFHAETIACEKCGPKVYLTDSKGEILEFRDPIGYTGNLLDEGYIVAVKGNGGFHIATATTISEPIVRLRGTKERRQKPFAIMARDMEAVKSFAEVTPSEKELLQSYIKPIVLLKKSEEYYLSEEIAPGLHNIGVMLPYTGLHIMLFDTSKEPAFVMTSANPPGEPIVTENHEALRKLGDSVDYFLFHNRRIANRCDDSVVRLHNKKPKLIRRSRGYAPAPIRLRRLRRCVLGVGAETGSTICVASGEKAFLSQYIGDIEKLETVNFLRETIHHLIQITNSKVEAVACDLHPTFNSVRVAHEIAEELDCPLFRVQHHHAHTQALMAEKKVDEMISIVLDGFGYGSDGKAWGGEILYCNSEDREIRRLASLEEQPLIGGDLAAYYPLRMVAGILKDEAKIEEWLLERSNWFPHGEVEVRLILSQLRRGDYPSTTSCGRVLDAVSALLGVCFERTYEGEPAMKLESAAVKGRDVLSLKPEFKGNTLNTTFLLRSLFNVLEEHSRADLARSAQSYIARGVGELAVREAERLGVNFVGLSGGVAYNEHISTTIRRVVKREGLKFVEHELLPPGDGCISLGQIVSVGSALS